MHKLELWREKHRGGEEGGGAPFEEGSGGVTEGGAEAGEAATYGGQVGQHHL